MEKGSLAFLWTSLLKCLYCYIKDLWSFTKIIPQVLKDQFGHLQAKRMIQICFDLQLHLTLFEMYDFEICSSLTFPIEFHRIGFNCNCNILPMLTYICVNIWPTLALCACSKFIDCIEGFLCKQRLHFMNKNGNS